MEEKKELTKRQEEVLNYIKKFIAEHGYPPAVREIGAGIGLNSPATVFVHVKNLEKLGCIRQSSNKFRTIELLVENEYLEKDENVIKVPLLGKITAGSPITAIEQPDEFFDLPAALMPKSGEVFTLHVSGESMINRGIFDNDYVIVKRQQNAKNGDIVVAMTDENEVTLKTFYKEKDHIRLQPENSTMDPIIVPNCEILGKVIGVFRKM